MSSLVGRFITYCIARDKRFYDRLENWWDSKQSGSTQHGWEATSFRLGTVLAIVILCVDAANGAWLLRQGILWFVGAVVVVPFLLVWLLTRWAGVQTNAPTPTVPEAGWGFRAGYRVLSAFVLGPLFFYAIVYLERGAKAGWEAEQLRPIQAALRAGNDQLAADLLRARLSDRQWLAADAALASLVNIRAGERDEAQRWADTSVRKHAIRYNKACGWQLMPVRRDSCESYVSQLDAGDEALNVELKASFCSAFGNRFPEPPQWPELAPLKPGQGRWGCYPPPPAQLDAH